MAHLFGDFQFKNGADDRCGKVNLPSNNDEGKQLLILGERMTKAM